MNTEKGKPASSSDSVEFKSKFEEKKIEENCCPTQVVEDTICSKNRDDGTEQQSSHQVIGRQVLRSEGVYVKGYVEDYEVNFTIDTGASRTVLSRKAYNNITKSKRPKLEDSNTLASADGKPLQEFGKANFAVKIGKLEFETEIIVANIEDEALLGLDVLMKSDWGPADLRLSDGIMLLGGTTIPCIKIDQSGPVRQIRVADNVDIPPRSEIIIDVFVDRFDDDPTDVPKNFVLEPKDDFIQEFPVVMAPSVVDISEDVTLKVRIMNPFDEEYTLKQDTVLGNAEELDSEPLMLMNYENVDEIDNNAPVRRIKLNDHINPVNWETNVGIIRNITKKGTADGGKSGIVPNHLIKLYKDATDGHTPVEQSKIADLLNKFSDTFSKSDTDLGHTHLVEHRIDTENAAPIRQPPRRVPLAFAEEEKKLIDQMKEQGIIRKSSSPWSSPLVLVVKKNGKVRPCVDYRRINAVTVKDAFPLPRIQDCLDTVAGATLFSTFDLTSSYHQIPVRSQDIPKTAFVTKYGLFEFCTMPFGLCGGPPTCQRLMELVLNGLQWQICLIYLDDIICFSNNFEDHMERLDTVLQRISEAGLKLKPEKCELLKSEVTFLGHLVSDKGIQPDPNNTAKIQSWPVPKTVTEVRQIIGLGSYYRRFIRHFSAIVKPLTELTKKNNEFTWTQECQIAFERLKTAFISTDIMALPKDEGEFYLDTDACDVSIGAVLSQIQDGQMKVIAYGSRTLNKAERNYCTTDKELLAVRYFIEYYRQYLLGRTFCVRTDHQALVWLFSLKEPKGRIARWLEILSAFDFCIEYRPGNKHGNADTMSRCFNPQDCDCPKTDNLEYLKCGPCQKCQKRALDMASSLINNDSNVDNLRSVKTRQQSSDENIWTPWNGGYSRDELQSLQKNDPDIGPLYKWKESDTRPDKSKMVDKSPTLRHYWYLWDSIEIIEGLIFKRFMTKNGIEEHTQFIVPLKLKEVVLKNLHNSVISGHLGIKKTKGKVHQKYYWYEMKEDIAIWISKCEICGANKPPPKSPRAPLGSMPVGAPLDRIATDILGPLPITPRGNRYILTVTDYFTKWVEIFAVPDQTATTCAEIILNEIICRYGCPLSIHSDQGRNYESEIFQQLCIILEIRKTRSSPKNPKCNGQIERFNRTLISMIKAYLQGEQTNWDLNLGCLAGAYRACPNESTGLTPNLMMLGREIKLPYEMTREGKQLTDNDKPLEWGTHTLKIRDRMQKAHEIARKKLEVSAQRRKAYYDIKANLQSYKTFDKVWFLDETRKEGISPKLQPLYSGPYLVLQKINDLNYKIQLNGQGIIKVVNHDKLKPYLAGVTPKWMTKIIQKK